MLHYYTTGSYTTTLPTQLGCATPFPLDGEGGRFPKWMWGNQCMAEFFDWCKDGIDAARRPELLGRASMRGARDRERSSNGITSRDACTNSKGNCGTQCPLRRIYRAGTSGRAPDRPSRFKMRMTGSLPSGERERHRA